MRRQAWLGAVLSISAVTIGCGTAANPSPSTSPGPTRAATQSATPAASASPTGTTGPADAGIPAPRGYHALVDVPGEGILLISGSARPPDNFFADTWAFSPSAGWSNLEPDPNVAVTDHAAFDVASERVVAGVGETWLYEPGAAAWERLRVPGPGFAQGSRSAYDSQSDRIVLFSADGSTWALDVDGATWTRMAPPESPPARGWGGMAYDAAVDRVVLFGGVGAGDEHLADTWTYDYDSDSWMELETDGSPSGRTYAAMTYDAAAGRMLLFGGASGAWEAETVHDDTWSLDLETATSGAWTRLEPASAPSARAWHAMAFDAESGLIVLFGGGPDRRHYTDETWFYDSAADAWSRWQPD